MIIKIIVIKSHKTGVAEECIKLKKKIAILGHAVCILSKSFVIRVQLAYNIVEDNLTLQLQIYDAIYSSVT